MVSPFTSIGMYTACFHCFSSCPSFASFPSGARDVGHKRAVSMAINFSSKRAHEITVGACLSELCLYRSALSFLASHRPNGHLGQLRLICLFSEKKRPGNQGISPLIARSVIRAGHVMPSTPVLRLLCYGFVSCHRSL